MRQSKDRTAGRRRLATYPIVIIAILLLILPIGILQGSDPSAARSQQPSEPPRTIAHTDVNPYGGNFFLHLEAENWKVDRTLRMASEAGLGWVKQQFPWESIERGPGLFLDEYHNKPTWEKFDYIVDTAAKYGLQVIARLDRPPDWAREANSTPMSPPKDYAAFGRFAHEVAKHYKGRIRYYQIWNEPNLTEEWGGKPVNPAEYVRLLRTAYEEIKRADPDAYVISAPLAQTTESNPAHLNEIDYLTGMYAAGAKPYFDVLFANAYGFSSPPEDPPDPAVLNFSRFLLLREVMERNGDEAKPMWFNEFGWNAPSEDVPVEGIKWGRVSEAQQAEYTVRAVQLARQNWPWAGVFNIWFFRQDGHLPPSDAQYYFRVVDVGFTPRLLYGTVKEAASPARVAGPGRFQETHPALTRVAGWRYVYAPRAEAAGAITPNAVGDTLAIAFSGGSLGIVARTGPDGGRLYITLDDNGVEGLPKDADGSAYLDLYSAEVVERAEIPLATGLRPGSHRLTLTLAPEKHPRSNGQVVLIDAFVVGEANQFPWLETTAGLVALVAVLGLVVWRRRVARRGDG